MYYIEKDSKMILSDLERLRTDISELINRVLNIVSTLKNQPEIFLTGRNSIQIEFENIKGDYLEFEFFEDGRVSKYYENSIKSYSRNVSEKNILKSVKDFYAVDKGED